MWAVEGWGYDCAHCWCSVYVLTGIVAVTGEIVKQVHLVPSAQEGEDLCLLDSRVCGFSSVWTATRWLKQHTFLLELRVLKDQDQGTGGFGVC